MAVNRAEMDPSFWNGKRVLISGHTGFKGSWLSFWLDELGCQVYGIATDPPTAPSLFNQLHLSSRLAGDFRCDIRSHSELEKLMVQVEPELVFHLAAQPLVLMSYREPLNTFATNVLGTANLLETLRSARPRAVVVVTSDKVYAPTSSRHPFNETDRLGGADPYSASKAASELVVESYRSSFLGDLGVNLATARAGNVIGGGDWASNRLIPDAVRAWSGDRNLSIRLPDAVRPWQHVLDCLHGYLLLAQMIYHHGAIGGTYNFGPPAGDMISVSNIIEIAATSWGEGARYTSDTTPSRRYENDFLSLDSTKSNRELKWIPKWNTQTAVEKSIKWYRDHYRGVDAKSLCLRDLVTYSEGFQ